MKKFMAYFFASKKKTATDQKKNSTTSYMEGSNYGEKRRLMIMLLWKDFIIFSKAIFIT